jgi:predicted phosphodiesterase
MRTLYLGDIHGDLGIVKWWIEKLDVKNANIIQVGDFGVGFKSFEKDKRYLEMFHHILVKNNVFIWAIRGNHDYKPYFDNDPFGFTNIKLVKDYTVLEFSDKRILCIGGAHSVDRMYRMTDLQRKGNHSGDGLKSWWVDEKFIFDEDKLREFRNIDIVVTHTAPVYCPIDNRLGLGSFVEGIINDTGDVDLRYDLLEERNLLTLTFDILKENNNITNAYYGHFHKSESIEYNGTKHRLLGVNEIWEERF